MSAGPLDLSGFEWARLLECEEDAAACHALLRRAVVCGGRLPVREASTWLNLTTTQVRGLAGRLQACGLSVLAADAVYLLPLRQGAPKEAREAARA